VENLGAIVRSGVDDRGRSCGEPTSSCGTRSLSPPALAQSNRPGIELLPRTPATEGGTARRRGSERREVACRLVAQRLGDEVAGTGEEELSTGSVTGTGHPKGPCDSYSQGPFSVVRTQRCTQDGRADFRWNRKNVRRSPCAARRAGHRTSPTHSGNGERDSSETRVQTEDRRLAGGPPRRQGDEAAGTGGEELPTGSVTSTGQPKGPWNSYFRGPFTYFRRSPGALPAHSRRMSGESADPPVTATLGPW